MPARDEEDHVQACLVSVRAALGRLPPEIGIAVAVVLDRCRDRTPERVAALLDGWPDASVLRVSAVGGLLARHPGAGPATAPVADPVHLVAGSGVGGLRDLGVGEVLARLGRTPTSSTWLLHTDADTTVPPDWAVDHLRLAADGAVGVAGSVVLAATAELSPEAWRRHQRIVQDGTDGADHRHVYGANLGVRADAYQAVGGFPVDGPGEDHGLWLRLQGAGYPLEQPFALQVRTSARIHGRATGGLADLLRELHDPLEASPAS